MPFDTVFICMLHVTVPFHVSQRVPDVFFCQMLAKRVLREVCIMRRLIHPYIISCKPSYWEEYTIKSSGCYLLLLLPLMFKYGDNF